MPAGLRPPTSCSLHLKHPSPLPHTPFQTRLEGQAHLEPLSQPRVGGPRPSWLFRLCLEQPTRPPSTGLHLREWGHSRQLLPQPPGGCTARGAQSVPARVPSAGAPCASRHIGPCALLKLECLENVSVWTRDLRASPCAVHVRERQAAAGPQEAPRAQRRLVLPRRPQVHLLSPRSRRRTHSPRGRLSRPLLLRRLAGASQLL